MPAHLVPLNTAAGGGGIIQTHVQIEARDSLIRKLREYLAVVYGGFGHDFGREMGDARMRGRGTRLLFKRMKPRVNLSRLAGCYRRQVPVNSS
jgi:hypothetical protein